MFNLFKKGKNIDIVSQYPEFEENTLNLGVLRFSTSLESTLGFLYEVTRKGGKFLCFTLEDEEREEKIEGETRIPEGRYEITLRTVGGFHQRYLERFGKSFHKGMLWIRNVPDFEYVLIHCGNVDADTMGCLLVGDSCIQNVTKEGFIGHSTNAYRRIYPEIANQLLRGKRTFVTYRDFCKLS